MKRTRTFRAKILMLPLILTLGFAFARCSPVSSSIPKTTFRKQLEIESPHPPRAQDESALSSMANDIRVDYELYNDTTAKKSAGALTLNADELKSLKDDREAILEESSDLPSDDSLSLPQAGVLSMDVSKKELDGLAKTKLYAEIFEKDGVKKLKIRLISDDARESDVLMLLSKLKRVSLKFPTSKLERE